MMLYPKLALIVISDVSVGIVTDPVPVTDVLPMRFHVKLPFERVYTYLERERIAKAVLFLYTKIVAVFPYTVVQIQGPHITEEKKVRMRWR